MKELLFALASFLIALFAFSFGAKRLFKKKKPLYFQLYVCAAGCLALWQLSCAVNLWCGAASSFSIGMLGVFGCNFFLLSANYGTLDRIVDEGNNSRKARALAALAPVCLAAPVMYAFFLRKRTEPLGAWMWLVMLLPALPASYFNLKHILLPMDDIELLRAVRPCNYAALVFYALTAAYGIVTATAGATAGGIIPVLISLSSLVLTLFAVKGAAKWEI